MFCKNKKRNVIVMIILIFILIFVIHIKNRISFDIMIDSIEENNILKLERALMIGNPNYVKGNALWDHLCEAPFKKSPLQLACYKGNFDMVKLMVEKGADVNYTKINAVYSPLICTILGQSEKDLEIVNYLIGKGADVTYRCNVERPVISWLVRSKTVSKNGLEILKRLVDAGADVKQMNYLKDACYWKHNDLIMYFIDECDYSANGGEIIQQYCRGVNKFSLDIFELLIRNGADIYETDKDSKNAIDYLIETTEGDTSWVDVVKSLHEKYNY